MKQNKDGNNAINAIRVLERYNNKKTHKQETTKGATVKIQKYNRLTSNDNSDNELRSGEVLQEENEESKTIIDYRIQRNEDEINELKSTCDSIKVRNSWIGGAIITIILGFTLILWMSFDENWKTITERLIKIETKLEMTDVNNTKTLSK